MSRKHEIRTLKQVALTEKQISTSFGEASFSAEEHFEFELNEK